MAINPYDPKLSIDPYALDNAKSTSLLPEEQQQKLRGEQGVPVFFSTPEEEENNNLLDAFKYSIDQPLENMATTFQALGMKGGESFLRNLVEAPEDYEEAAGKFMNAQGEGFDFGYLPRAVFEQAGQIAGSIISRVGGAAIGGAIGNVPGAAIGAFTAPALFEAIQIAGPTAFERARNNGREEPNWDDWWASMPSTVTSGALNAIGIRNVGVLNKLGGAGLKPTSLRIGKALVEEKVTEGLQSYSEQIGGSAFTDAGVKIDHKQALGEALIGGFAAGVTQTGAELLPTRTADDTVPPITPPPPIEPVEGESEIIQDSLSGLNIDLDDNQEIRIPETAPEIQETAPEIPEVTPEVTPEVKPVTPVPEEVVEAEPSFLSSNFTVPLGLTSITDLPSEKRFAANKRINSIYRGEQDLGAFTDQELDEVITSYQETLDYMDVEGFDPSIIDTATNDLNLLIDEKDKRSQLLQKTVDVIEKSIDLDDEVIEEEPTAETEYKKAELRPEGMSDEEAQRLGFISKLPTKEQSEKLQQARKQKEAESKKATPKKPIPLKVNKKNPVNKKEVEVEFLDDESARVYQDETEVITRGGTKKVKKKLNQTAKFRKEVANKFGIGLDAYKKLSKKYTKYVDESSKAATTPNFKPASFEDFAEDQIGIVSSEDIINYLSEKNISTSDNAFKKYLRTQAGVDSLDQVQGFKRKEIMRNITSLPLMGKKNSPIDKAFNVERDNIEIATRKKQITDRALKINNKAGNTQAKLIRDAKSAGVPDQQIFEQSTGKPFTKMDIARAIATREENLMQTAEETAERTAATEVPNVIVEKRTAKKSEVNQNAYLVKFPDKSKVRVPLDDRLEGDQANNTAAKFALEERVDRLRKQNEKRKNPIVASDNDYNLAVRSMLLSGEKPIAILERITTSAKYSTTPSLDGFIAPPLPQVSDLRNAKYRFKEKVDVKNILSNMRRDTRRMFPNADVAVVDELFDENNENVAGLTKEDLIMIALDDKFTDPTETLYHEAVHWFDINGFFDDDAIQMLKENESRIRNIAEGREGKPVENFGEAVAIASGVYNYAKRNKGASDINMSQFLPPMRRFFEKLYKLFSRFKTFLNKKKYNNIEDLFEAMDQGVLFKETLETQRQLTPENEDFVKENFKDAGDVGSYKGGQLVQKLTPAYKAAVEKYDPFWLNTKAFNHAPNSYLDSMNLELFVQNELKERINKESTKKTQGKFWIEKIYGGKGKKQLSAKYEEETGLRAWLSIDRNIDRVIDKEEVQDYVNAHSDIYSVMMYGNPLELHPIDPQERAALRDIETEINLVNTQIRQNNDQLRTVASGNQKLFKNLRTQFYDGPNSDGESAFYSAMYTDSVIDEWKKEAKKEDFPLNVSDKDFNHLKNALNSDVAPPDFVNSAKDMKKTEDILGRMLQPFYSYNIALDMMISRMVDSEVLEKFITDVEARSSIEFIDGKVNVTQLQLTSDNLIEYINGFKSVEEINNFTKANGFTMEDGELYNINQLLVNNLFLRNKSKLFDTLLNDPQASENPDVTYSQFVSLKDPKWGVGFYQGIDEIDLYIAPIKRMHIRAAALLKGIENLPRDDAGLRQLAEEEFIADPNAVDVQIEPMAETTAAQESWRLSFNNLRSDNYREFRIVHTPSSLGQQPYINNDHFEKIPGAFMHMRVRDIYDVDGKRYLFIEEIQSDYFSDLKKALNLEFPEGSPDRIAMDQNKNITNELAEKIDAAYKKGMKVGEGGKVVGQTIPLIGKYNLDFNAYQDFAVNFLTKVAIDNNYAGIRHINTNLQAERNMQNLSDSFDNLYYLSSVNPNDMELKEVEGINFYYHKPSGQSITIAELQERPDIFTAADSHEQQSGKMAAANLLAERFASNPNSYEYTTYVNHVRLIGMLGSNVGQDITVPLNQIKDIQVVEGQILPRLEESELVRHEGAINHLTDDGSKKSSSTLDSLLPKGYSDIISEQVKFAIPPAFKRNLVSTATPLTDGGFVASNVQYQQNRLEGIGNGYFNMRSISPELVRGFMKQGFEQYGAPMSKRLITAMKKIDGGKGYKVAGIGTNAIAAELYDGANLKDIRNNNWWANRLFENLSYDELTDIDKNTVKQERMKAELLIESKLGTKPASTQGREVRGERFRFQGVDFDEGFTEQFARQSGGVAVGAKFSSTPANVQKANIVTRQLDKLRNLTDTFSGFGTLINAKNYRRKRNLLFGNISRAEEVASFMFKKIGAITNPVKGKDTPERQKLRKEFTEFMEGGRTISPDIISDPKLRPIAVKAKNLIDQVGEALVKKGLLSREIFERNRGSYMPQLYMKYIMQKPDGSFYDYTQQRSEDLTEETKLVLGDIADLSPEFRVFTAISRPLRDIAMLDFFEAVSKEEGWSIQDDKVMVSIDTDNGTKMKVSAFWLKEEADRLNEQANIFQASEPAAAEQMRQKANEYNAIANPAIEKLGGIDVMAMDVPKGFRRLPNTKKYGMLKGVAVRNEIYNDVIGSFTMGDTDNWYNRALGAMKKGTSIWKTLKVPLNPPTVVRNVGSNMILMNLVGNIAIHKVIPRMRQALDQIRNNGPAWQVSKKHGIIGTGFNKQEMYQASEELIALEEQVHALGPITKFFSMPKMLMKKILKKGGDLYQFTESVGKTAIVIDYMEKNASKVGTEYIDPYTNTTKTYTQQDLEFDAFDLAQKALFDYSDLPEGGKLFRSAPIGMPFFTFYYKAFPALVEVAVKHPMRFAPYVALSAGLSALTSVAFDFDDDEAEKLKKSLEPWIARRTGVHVLPWKDSDGRFQFIDIGYFFPWTMYADAVNNAFNGEFMELQRSTGLFSGPFSDILMALKTNRDPFTQRVIWDERDPVEERVKNLMWYTYSIGMPSWLTPTGAISKTARALKDTPRPTGQPADTVPQAFLRFAGINLYGLEPRETRQRNRKRMQREIDDTRQRMRYMMKNKSLDQETKDARRRRYISLINQKQQEMTQYLTDTALPEGLMNRKSKFRR